jgi:hypothetical protein
MGELLVAPDVVDLVCVWLRAELPDVPNQVVVPVHRAIPSPRPVAFVTVRLLGGGGRDSVLPLDRVTVAVEAWAGNVAAAHDLAQNARAVVHAAQGVVHAGVQVYRVEEGGGPVELPDPLSNQSRVTFTVELLVRIRRPDPEPEPEP